MNMKMGAAACLRAAGGLVASGSASAPNLFLSATLAGWAASSDRTGVIVGGDGNVPGNVPMATEVAATTIPNGVNGAFPRCRDSGLDFLSQKHL